MASYSEQTHLHTDAPFRAARLIYPGNLQAALRRATADPTKSLFGVAHGIPSVYLTKVIASTKPDFIWIDVEHGMFSREVLCDAIQAVQHHSEGKTLCIVRIPKHDEISLNTVLDAGASGIVIPRCESAQEVKDMMNAMYYPPVGIRSFSPWMFTPGISDESLYPSDAFNMTTANKHIAIIPQIESVKGIENIEEIAAVPGVSAMMFGPGDYQADAQIPIVKFGGPHHPRLAEAMGKFAAAGKKFNLPLMGTAPRMEIVPKMLAQGYRCITVLFDVWGMANMVHSSLLQSREFANMDLSKVQLGPPGGIPNGKAPNGVANGPPNGAPNGTATNGITNGEVPNGKPQEKAPEVDVKEIPVVAGTIA